MIQQNDNKFWPPSKPEGREANNGPAKTEVFEFILLDQFSMMSVMAAIEPLRMANRLLGYQAYEWRLVSELGGGVSASNGIEVSVSGELENDFIPDYSVVCVGMSLVAQNQSRLLTILNKTRQGGRDCGGGIHGDHFSSSGQDC